ncbi:MAG: hypothetical protein M0026_04490 [Nocardiopsaceae bacterium]|mgnify:CR=1 FL=1|nr:hypothetical protein [Nocardiopsaceae bacterium]
MMSRNGRSWLAVLAVAAFAAAIACFGRWAHQRWAFTTEAALLAGGGAALLLALALAAVLITDARSRREAEERRGSAQDAPERLDPAPSGAKDRGPTESPWPYRRKHIFRWEVPSARADYPFLFSAVVCWRGSDLLDSAAEGAAVCAIERRVSDLAAKEQPQDHISARYRLAAALGAEPCGHPGVAEVWAEDVRLEIAPEDEERLNRLRELRKMRAVRDEERAAAPWERGSLDAPFPAPTGRQAPDLYREHAGGGGNSGAYPPVPEAAGNGAAAEGDIWSSTGPFMGQVYGFTAEGNGAAPQESAYRFDLEEAGRNGESADPLEEEGDPWLRVAGTAALDWADEEEYTGFLERFAVFLKSNGYGQTAARLREEYGLGPGFAQVFGSAADQEPLSGENDTFDDP